MTTEARYLPTRSQDDRLDRLRELLRDVSDVSCVSPVTGLNPGFDVQISGQKTFLFMLNLEGQEVNLGQTSEINTETDADSRQNSPVCLL